MSPVTEIRLVVQRELRRNFRSAKGIALLVLTLLGGAAFSYAASKIIQVQREEVPAALGLPPGATVEPEHLRAFAEKFYLRMYGDADLARSLADAPALLYALFWTTVFLSPILVALMGFDAISSDIQHRTVRYWTLRTRRWTYFASKWLGLWATVSAVTFVMDAFVWVYCTARGEATFATSFGYGLRFWLISSAMTAVWCGVAIFISSLMRTPIVALLATFASFFVLWVLYIIAAFAAAKGAPGASALAYAVYPNHIENLLLHPRGDKLLTGVAVCLGMAGLYVGSGSALFARRDV